jgi:predicted nucleic acid-binding protein
MTRVWTLVDSNIIFDIAQPNLEWKPWSLEALTAQTEPVINPIIFAELCYGSGSMEEASSLLGRLGLGYVELSRAALYRAAQAFRKYRERGGIKLAPLPDFFVGAQAAVEGYTLLTRDPRRYRTYFPEAKLLCPEN